MAEDFLQNKLFKIIILSVAGLIAICFIFGLGMFVGMEKADYSFRWAEEYHKNFAGPRAGFFGTFMGTENQFLNSNGVFGKILKIDGNILTIKENDGDNSEKAVLIGEKTSIISLRKNLKISDLKIGDNAVVIGSPNSSGQIQADLIRVMPGNSLPKNQLPQNVPPGNIN